MSYSLAKDAMKILLLEGVHESAVQVFQQAGYTHIEHHKKALEPAELKAKLAEGVRMVGIRSRTQLTADILQEAPKLFSIGCFCIGTNQVDSDAAERAGVPVFNAPFANTRSVAELVLAEMILLLRRVPEKSHLAHQGIWQKSAQDCFEARGKTLGIIGYGHIGSQLSVLAEGLGMRVKFYDIEHKLPMGNAESVPSMQALLAQSDIVSLHVPATEQTENLIDAQAIKAMKPGAVLINASRGKVVDLDALAEAIQAKYVAGAAIDVFPVEPGSNAESFQSPLQTLPNVILTPHVGGSTTEAQAGIGVEVAEKLVKYSDNGSTLMSVNFPQVALPTHDGHHRILHIHYNRPGVLNAINQIFSEQYINIASQYLQTTATIGYVVMDVASSDTNALVKALKQVDGTLRCRVLF